MFFKTRKIVLLILSLKRHDESEQFERQHGQSRMWWPIRSLDITLHCQSHEFLVKIQFWYII